MHDVALGRASKGSGELAVALTETSTDVAEKLYEGMFLLDSNKFVANPDDVTRHLLDILDAAEATVVTHRPWQDGRLAYEIEGKRKGLHYLVYFHMPGRGIPVITRKCKLSEYVLRHLVIRQPQTLFDAMVQALNPQVEEPTAEESKGDDVSSDAQVGADKEKVAADDVTAVDS